MFKTTLTLFDRYYREMDSGGTHTFNRDLACEVRDRLEQLQFIIERVHNLRAALGRLPKVSLDSNQTVELHYILLEIKLFTESFYYLAGRVRTILRNKNALLPGLQKFECVGVRDVRNKLLEHA